jgi:hypothetical protein
MAVNLRLEIFLRFLWKNALFCHPVPDDFTHQGGNAAIE